MANSNALQQGEKSTLRKSSRAAIQQIFGGLNKHFHRKRWIGNNNRYRKNCIATLSKDAKSGTVRQAHLAEYMAASAPLHCADGWSFLGRALKSHTQGDPHVARHLGYYAELRGALALLAAEGIGIFSRQHFVLDSSKSCQQVPKPHGRSPRGTHEITWLILEHWAERKPSATLLAKIISPNGISLQEWLGEFLGGVTAGPVGNRWLKSWGLDIRRLSDDHDSRNEASYRPSRLSLSSPLAVEASSQFLGNLWGLCEPTGNSRFDVLDRHLLRLSLKLTYEAVTGRKVISNPGDFESEIVKMLSRVVNSGASEKVWRDFLTWKTDPVLPAVIAEAEGTVPTNDPRHHIQVISRAALLLRVATGACSLLIKNAGIDRKGLEFWWQPIGEELGIWEPGNSPEDLTDLWADIEVALDEAKQWELTNPGPLASCSKWRREQSLSISVLGECERIALWGLGL